MEDSLRRPVGAPGRRRRIHDACTTPDHPGLSARHRVPDRAVQLLRRDLLGADRLDRVARRPRRGVDPRHPARLRRRHPQHRAGAPAPLRPRLLAHPRPLRPARRHPRCPGMITLDAECVLSAPSIVGESPDWHCEEGRLYWIDIRRQLVCRFDPRTRVNEQFPVDDIVTSLNFRRAGGLILTLRKTFAFFDAATGKLERLSDPEPDLPGNLFITSARETLTPEMLAKEPLAASLFASEVGVAGRPTNRFAG